MKIKKIWELYKELRRLRRKENRLGDIHEEPTNRNCDKTGFQRRCEFGYNKANEWHYVKDGDYPTEDLRQRTHGYYLTASKYEWNKWLVFEVAYFTGTVFTKGGNILDNVIAWKEIVPPKERE